MAEEELPFEPHGNRRAGRGTRRILMVAYPGAQMLDVTGPLEVFAGASELDEYEARRRGRRAGAPAYAIEVAAPERGPVAMSSGLQLVATRGLSPLRAPIDTLIVAGGHGSRAAADDARLVDFIARAARRARRVASVCTGSFLLAKAGLLRGRRATTHWAACDALARTHPEVDVQPDPIFVRDGRFYTSAGVTAGMDLALALVEEDLGRPLAMNLARRFVLYLKRPGGQAQFSAQLALQAAQRDPLREVQLYVSEHPEADLSVETLAQRAAMSPRNFARVFVAEVGITPARFVERSRIEAARRRLEEGVEGMDEIAVACGFGSAETMRRAFQRGMGVAPAAYRERFRGRVPAIAGDR